MKQILIWFLLTPSGSPASQFSHMSAKLLCTGLYCRQKQMVWILLRCHETFFLTLASVKHTHFKNQARKLFSFPPAPVLPPGDFYALPLMQTLTFLAEDDEVHLHFWGGLKTSPAILLKMRVGFFSAAAFVQHFSNNSLWDSQGVIYTLISQCN